MKRYLLFFFLLLFLLFPSKTFAEDNFLTDYTISYSVAANGFTHADIKVTLTNKTETYYASYYKVQLGLNDIENISASDGGGKIKPDINKSTTETTIGLPLNQQVVGLNKKTTFNISFDTADIAENLGKILEVNIPGLANQNDFESFNVNVTTPKELGLPAYLKPPIVNATSSTLSFTKSTLGKSGVYIAYGRDQIYSFDLTYHLKNDNLFKVRTEIALPPQTNYQDIQINSMSPAPLNVKKDEDGNWLAQYELKPSEKVDVKVLGKVKITLSPESEELTGKQIEYYTRSQPYWETDSSQIKQLAQELKTPQAIYNYVAKTLSYDYSRITSDKPRLGAQKILSDPTSAVCLEFTDLFIALSRAAGIPAREVDGFAYTQNSKERPLSLVKDVLHAWPEYYDYDKKTWIMVDPTWGNTTGGSDYFHTLDFDHFAFTIKGVDSSYPVPAGGYKLKGGENQKDVLVSVDPVFEESLPVLKTDLSFTKSIIPWAPVIGEMLIKNLGSVATKKQDILIETSILNPNSQTISLDSIPPYGSIAIPLKFTTSSILTNKEDTVKITIGETSFTQKVLISPFNFSRIQLIAGGGVLIVIFISIIIIIAAKSRNIYLSRQRE